MEENDQELINPVPQNRVIPIDPQPGMSIAGGESIVPYEINEMTGNHDAYLPPVNDDLQSAVLFDTDACTDYGCKNSLEIQMRRHLKMGHYTADEIATLTAHGFIVNGVVQKLSAHFNAILSGTKYGIGNYAYKPWDSARNDGMVPDSLCPFPRTQKTPPYRPENYYDRNVITAEAWAAAAAWKKVHETRYELIQSPTPAILTYHLKQAPLAIITGCCTPWSGGIIPACPLTTGHCTCLYGFVFDQTWKDLDTYVPTFKQFAWPYNISYAVKGVLWPASMAPVLHPVVTPVTYHWNRAMEYGQTSTDIKNLQDFLKTQKDSAGKTLFPIAQKSTGYYGLVTAGAVLRFQMLYGLGTPAQLTSWGGRHVGPLTLPVLNKIANQ